MFIFIWAWFHYFVYNKHRVKPDGENEVNGISPPTALQSPNKHTLPLDYPLSV